MTTSATFISLAAAVQSDAWSEFLVVLIWAAFGLGCICAFVSRHQLKRERAELQAIRENYKDPSSIKAEVIMKEIDDKKIVINEKNLGEHLTYRRLQLICQALDTKQRGKQNVQPPHMSDLHNLTEQAIMSSRGPTWLRIIASVLLIIGICGTLMGVHEVLGKSNSISDLSLFASALNPSRWAVLFTILLFVFRGMHLMATDRFLYNLDRVTMVRFLPALVPSSDLENSIKNFAESVGTYNKHMEQTMGPLANAVQQVGNSAHDMKEALDNIKTNSDILRSFVTEEIDPARKELNQRELSMKESFEASRALLGDIKLTLSNVEQLNSDLLHKAGTFQETMRQVQLLLDNEKLKLAANIELNKAALELRAKLDSLANITTETTELKADIENAVKAMRETSESFETEVSSARRQLATNQSALSNITQQTHAINQASQELRTAANATTQAATDVRSEADNFKTKLDNYDGTIKAAGNQMATFVKNLDDMAGKIDKQLNDILLAAHDADNRVIKPSRVFEKFGLKVKETRPTPARKSTRHQPASTSAQKPHTPAEPAEQNWPQDETTWEPANALTTENELPELPAHPGNELPPPPPAPPVPPHRTFFRTNR